MSSFAYGGPFTFMVVGPEYLNRNIASSLALYTYLAMSTDRCKAASMEFFLSTLNKVVLRVLSSMENVADGTVNLGTGSIVICGDGQSCGFKSCLSTGIHLTVQSLFKKDPRPQIVVNFGVP